MLYLLVGIGQAAKLFKGQEVTFDIFDTGFHDALFLGVTWRTRRDEKAIVLGKVGVGALDRRIVPAGLANSRFKVINNGPGRHAPKEFKGTTMTSEPGKHLLIPDDFHVLVSAPSQGHDEKPGFKDFPG